MSLSEKVISALNECLQEGTKKVSTNLCVCCLVYVWIDAVNSHNEYQIETLDHLRKFALIYQN